MQSLDSYFKQKIQPHSWLILGAGKTGNATAEFIKKFDGNVIGVWDEKDTTGVDFSSLELSIHVVVSPGFSKNHPWIKTLEQHHAIFTSDLDLVLENFPGKIFAVTGTNGKSTIALMSHLILEKFLGNVSLVGNIGYSPAQAYLENKLFDHVVIEVSSYQIEWNPNFIPTHLAFTSFSPDHLARHGSLENYFRMKWNLVERLKPGSHLVLSKEVFQQMKNFGLNYPSNIQVDVLNPDDNHHLSTPFFPSSFKDRPQDIFNGLMAEKLVGSELKNISSEKIFSGLEKYEPLPYRMQVIGKINGHLIINDSKSTNIESTTFALSFQKQPVILMIGGQYKGESFDALNQYSDHIQQIIIFGPYREKLKSQIHIKCEIKLFEKLSLALDHFLHSPQNINHPILFSPGCASFDEFKNFEERGDCFNKISLEMCTEFGTLP